MKILGLTVLALGLPALVGCAASVKTSSSSSSSGGEPMNMNDNTSETAAAEEESAPEEASGPGVTTAEELEPGAEEVEEAEESTGEVTAAEKDHKKDNPGADKGRKTRRHGDAGKKMGHKKKGLTEGPPAAAGKPAVNAAPPAAKPVAALPKYTGKGPCKLAVKGTSPIAKACSEGGVKAAKKAMKKMIKAAKKAGTKMECDECHPDDDYDELTDDGRDKFKKLLELSGN